MQKTRHSLTNLCAYTHMWKVLKERKLPSSAKPGLTIALLGFFCPLFWFALITGASKGELIFHACHSGLVFLVGVFLLVKGVNQHGQSEQRSR